MYGRLHNVSFLVTKLPPKTPRPRKTVRANMCTVLNGTAERIILSRFCLQLLNMEHALMGLFARKSFASQSLKRIGEDSIVHSACKNNQSTYERDTVRRLTLMQYSDRAHHISIYV